MKQPERAPRPLQKLSASAAPDLAFAVEPLERIAHEMPPLIVRYGQELDETPEPDWGALLRASALGGLLTVTARCGSALAGFVLTIVGPHLLYRSGKWGITNVVWLDPAYRDGMGGYRMLKFNRDKLTELGCKPLVIAHYIKTGEQRRLGILYRRLGYKPCEMSYVHG